jgi:cytochrome c biogenesis protein CcdA
MAGEAEAASEGIALAREVLPMVKEIFSMFGIGSTTSVASTPVAGPDVLAVLLRIADTLDKILAAKAT